MLYRTIMSIVSMRILHNALVHGWLRVCSVWRRLFILRSFQVCRCQRIVQHLCKFVVCCSVFLSLIVFPGASLRPEME